MGTDVYQKSVKKGLFLSPISHTATLLGCAAAPDQQLARE